MDPPVGASFFWKLMKFTIELFGGPWLKPYSVKGFEKSSLSKPDLFTSVDCASNISWDKDQAQLNIMREAAPFNFFWPIDG